MTRVSSVAGRAFFALVLIVASLALTPLSADAAAPTDSSPSQVSALRFNSRTYVFAKSATANSIVYRDIASGNSWKSISGSTPGSGPAVVVNGSQVWVFATGTNGQLYYTRSSDLATWSTWTSLGGSFVGAPGAVTGSPARSNSLLVGGRNSASGTYSYRYLQGSTWSSWYSAGTETYTTSPSFTLSGAPGDFVAWSFFIRGVKSPGSNLFEVGVQVSTTPEDPGPSRVTAGGMSTTNARSGPQSNAQGRENPSWYRTTSNALDEVPGYGSGPAGSVLSTPGVATDGINNWICAKTTSAGSVSCTTVKFDQNSPTTTFPYTSWVSIGGAVA